MYLSLVLLERGSQGLITMTWEPAAHYKALIGGILYRNVPQPIVCNGKSLISLTRNTETGQLAVSFELLEQNKSTIASVANNTITLHNTADYLVLRGLNRAAVVHKQSGRIWCDLSCITGNHNYELSVSCLLISESGYPVILHPDRSKFGAVNDNKAPNIAFLTLTTAPSSAAAGIGLENSPCYLLGLAIENFRAGIEITHSEANESI